MHMCYFRSFNSLGQLPKRYTKFQFFYTCVFGDILGQIFWIKLELVALSWVLLISVLVFQINRALDLGRLKSTATKIFKTPLPLYESTSD